MKILDLDLDFFLDKVPYFYDENSHERLPSDEYSPWKKSAVINFLENNCGLKTTKPLQGIIIQNHKYAFHFWRELIHQEKLYTPFDVIHIDSHADLGCGDSSAVNIMKKLLHRPIDERSNPEEGVNKLNSGSYLAYAIANRWISSLTYVTHSHQDDDVNRWHLDDFSEDAEYIQLKAVHPEKFDFSERPIKQNEVISTEKKVPFKKVVWIDYMENDEFDLAILCTSPNFTPVESDQLIPIIERYINTSNFQDVNNLYIE